VVCVKHEPLSLTSKIIRGPQVITLTNLLHSVYSSGCAKEQQIAQQRKSYNVLLSDLKKKKKLRRQ